MAAKFFKNSDQNFRIKQMASAILAFFPENYLLPSNEEHGFGDILMSFLAQQIIPVEPDQILVSTSEQPARLLSLISVTLQFMGDAHLKNIIRYTVYLYDSIVFHKIVHPNNLQSRSSQKLIIDKFLYCKFMHQNLM